jgi:hypothetical protein
VTAADTTLEVTIASIVVMVWLTIMVVRSARALARGDQRSVLFVQIVFYFFFGLPLVLDLLIGPPTFTYQRGFLLGQQDRVTNLIYLGYVAVTPLILAAAAGPRRLHVTTPPMQRLRGGLRVFAWAAMLTLPFVVLLAPAPEEYTRYAAYVGNAPGGNIGYHNVVVLVATLSVVSSVLVLTAPNTPAPLRVMTMPFLALGVWIHGKRSIVALALLLGLYLLWTRGVLRGRRFLAVSFSAALALGIFSYTYQTELGRVADSPATRNDAAAASPVYVNFRIDYGRDAVTRQTIYAELHPDELQVLEYRGQSLLFDLLFFVPRRSWPEKPYPYAVYATAAMFDIPPRDMGWGTTTSWLEEAIANLGWVGMLVGPLLPALVCRLGDRQRSPFAGLLTVTVASLLLILHLIAFMPLFALWVVTVIRRRAEAPAPPPASTPSGMRSRRR